VAAGVLVLAGGGVAAVWLLWPKGQATTQLAGPATPIKPAGRWAEPPAEVPVKQPVEAGVKDPVNAQGKEPAPAKVNPPAEPKGGNGIPARDLAELKAATVFVKVEAGPMAGSGSGFVMKLDGDTAYVVTNNHVVNPKVEIILPPAQPRGRWPHSRVPPSLVNPGSVVVPLPNAVLTCVFRSGTRDEQAIRSELVAFDPQRDLAVLKVTGVQGLPKPIDCERQPQLAETMPVFVFGFPFGRVLATNKGGPAITVGKGSVSSIRTDDRDEVALVQIDGALNPGNSGGPVVDEGGRLVGIAVATIKGSSGIGLAIPARELTRMLAGRVGGSRLITRKVDSGGADVEAEVRLIDPLGRVRDVALHYVPTDRLPSKPGRNPDGSWSELPGSQRVELKGDRQKAAGAFRVAAGGNAAATLWCQTSHINGDGKVVYTEPVAFVVNFSTPPPVATQPPDVSAPAGQPPAVGAVKVPEAQGTGEELAGQPRTVGDLTITDLKLRTADAVPCLCWARDGKSFFFLEPGGVLRRVALDGFKELKRLDLGRRCGWLALSAEGLVLTVTDLQEVWLLDVNGLRVKSRVPVPSVSRAVSSPALSVAVALSNSPPPIGSSLSVLDLKKGVAAGQFTGNDTRGRLVPTGFSSPMVSPDGKYLFVQGGMEQLCRLRITGTRLKFEEAGQRIAQGRVVNIQVSADSAFVCLPCGGGNYNQLGLKDHPEVGTYSTYVYPVTNLNKPAFTLAQGPYPMAVGFDPKAGLVYGQNLDHQLIVFGGAGVKLKEYQLNNGREVRQFLVHPAGRKLLVLTDAKLSYVELPQP
jgi:S1-C subfamily serine protease